MAPHFPPISLSDEHYLSFRLDYFGLLFGCLQVKDRVGKKIAMTKTQSRFASKQTSHQSQAGGGELLASITKTSKASNNTLRIQVAQLSPHRNKDIQILKRIMPSFSLFNLEEIKQGSKSFYWWRSTSLHSK